ncbi:MAG: hypothetical protein KKF21_06665 [Bacteroidetes bacterium]|nr:hypothetical protein [Bacteroidota bacterium]MBU1798045.1 hypothetical protein [Bacteroidota bacterium]
MKNRLITLLFSIIILFGCEDNSTNNRIENLNGVWENTDENAKKSSNGKWIPNNLHIANTEQENIIRVRILDPIACTDSYPEMKNSKIEFSQYGLNLSVLFTSDITAKFTIENKDSLISYTLYKTDKETYFGPCD